MYIYRIIIDTLSVNLGKREKFIKRERKRKVYQEMEGNQTMKGKNSPKIIKKTN